MAAIAFCLFVPIMYRIDMAVRQQELSLQEEQTLLSACESGMTEAIVADEHIFGTSKIREKAVNAFYQTYCTNKNMDIKLAKYNIPCIVLMDWDGYYICYTSPMTQKDDKGDILYDDTITEKLIWAETYGNSGYNYTIEYHLNNIVKITKKNVSSSQTYAGYYSDVYRELSDSFTGAAADLAVKKILCSKENFLDEKERVVLQITQDKINYFINQHNNYADKTARLYAFTMPGSGKDFKYIDDNEARILETPSIIAFSQGAQANTTSELINVFALAGTDMTYDDLYYINYMPVPDGNGGTTYQYMYHIKSCEKLNAHKAVRIDTAEGCAKGGANPCSCVAGHDPSISSYEELNGREYSGSQLISLINQLKGDPLKLVLNLDEYTLDGINHYEELTTDADGNVMRDVLTGPLADYELSIDCAGMSDTGWATLNEYMDKIESDYYIDPQGLYKCIIDSSDYTPSGIVARIRISAIRKRCA